jgi:outer membrane protein OmpA-like peptidoglycan-associated protein
MHARRLKSKRAFTLSLTAAIGAALSLVACGGPVVFEGKTALAIEGQPPPPPPPPPPPEPEPEPPKPPPRVEVRDNKIVIREKIQFEYNKAKIQEVSHSLLDEVVKVIQENPHIKKIRVEGHASSDGADYYNMQLSDRRAKAVMKYLVEHGIPQETLEAKGFGETKPIADNETEEGREKNRRVEFNIIEQDVTKKKVKVDQATGTETVIEERKESLKAPDAAATEKK